MNRQTSAAARVLRTPGEVQRRGTNARRACVLGGALVLVMACQADVTPPEVEETPTETRAIDAPGAPAADEAATASTICEAYRRRLTRLEGEVIQRQADPGTDLGMTVLREITTDICG